MPTVHTFSKCSFSTKATKHDVFILQKMYDVYHCSRQHLRIPYITGSKCRFGKTTVESHKRMTRNHRGNPKDRGNPSEMLQTKTCVACTQSFFVGNQPEIPSGFIDGGSSKGLCGLCGSPQNTRERCCLMYM